MREAIHIFRKDSRQFRVLIGAVLLWTALFGAAGTVNITLAGEIRGWTDTVAVVISQLSIYVLPVVWWFLVAQAMHADALPGVRQFWITRPYRRRNLFLAKALFVLAYITGPLALAQLVMSVARGYPLLPSLWSVLWLQGLVLTVIVLPSAVVAALTSTLAQFAVASFLLPMLFVVYTSMNSWGPFAWVRSSVAVMLIAVTGTAVLVAQFTRRRSGVSRLIGLLGVLVALVVLWALPWHAAFSVQSLLASGWSGRLSATLAPREPERTTVNTRGQLRVRFSVTGLPVGAALVCEGAVLRFEGPDETGWTLDTRGGLTSNFARTNDGCEFFVHPPAAFANAVGDRPVHIQSSIYLTVIGDPSPTPLVMADDASTVVPGLGVCAMKRFRFADGHSEPDGPFSVTCDPGWKTPAVRVGVDTTQSEVTRALSYSPFPSELMLRPPLFGVDSGAVRATSITVTTRAPISHQQITIDTPGVRLEDLR